MPVWIGFTGRFGAWSCKLETPAFCVVPTCRFWFWTRADTDATLGAGVPSAPKILTLQVLVCGLNLIIDTVQNRDTLRSMGTLPADILRENGVQVTAQRLAVLRAVSQRPHATADELADAVRDSLGTISRQAVYDALALLVGKGILRRIEPAHSPARYEDRIGDNHHHMICRVCGTTVDVDCAVGAAPCLQPTVTNGFQVDEAEVIYWGTCANCIAAAGSDAAADGRGRP